ncbi:MAG TPA: DUF1735 domain-containing protein [Puia sp.]|nr:DUF1735 domain-containing protein [Puia sp.]
MKRIQILVPGLITAALAGCLKDKPNVDFSNLGQIAEITTATTSPTPNAPAAGLAYFTGANLGLNSSDLTPDTVWFTVNIASPNPPTKDVPITLTIDQTALNNYISNPNHVQFALFPDSTYTIPTLTGTVKAGSMNRLATFYVVFYPWKVDPASSYMLPLTITQAPGCTISGNLGTIYFHQVGNPIAGVYTWNWTRWNNSDSSGPTSGGGTNLSATFSPINPTQIEVPSGYYIQPRYEVTFTNNAGTLSNFAVSLNAADVATMAGGGVTVTAGPDIIIADPVNGAYEFFYQALTGSGPRTVIDRFNK